MDTMLTNMELSATEAKQETEIWDEPPKYPWGLCIDLNEDALKKLGIDSLPEVGTSMSIMAKAEVQSASTSQYQGDKAKRMSLSLQITDMAVTPVARDAGSILYNEK